MLQPFFADSGLSQVLSSICEDAFNFSLNLVSSRNDPDLSILELFHGPTSAFKDVGARFLAASLEKIQQKQNKNTTILVATSGDTGGAVAAAFFRRLGFRVVVLFPEGRVSQRQQHQLTCWGDNISALSVRGSFDDCQRMVKQAFGNKDWVSRFGLASANSINIGRLLPQMTYYAASSLWHQRSGGSKPNYIIPTGNLGNAFSCIMARAVGLPIGDVILATNANRPIPDYLQTGVWEPRETVETLASAMDVGNPSNMERLRGLYPDHPQLVKQVSAVSVSDEDIRHRIGQEYRDTGEVYCPHTATALEVYRRLDPSQRHKHWIVVATAHPAKFDEIIEPITGTVPIPPGLAKLLDRRAQFETIEAETQELIDHLTELDIKE